MPYIRSGAVKVSDHHLRSPLDNVNQSCQTCHSFSEQVLTERILTIQNRTAELLRQSETAILDAMDAIVEAQAAGADDAQLEEARLLHRRASMRWDFISSENSTGFHSPQESARVLANAIDYARQAELVGVHGASAGNATCSRCDGESAPIVAWVDQSSGAGGGESKIATVCARFRTLHFTMYNDNYTNKKIGRHPLHQIR